MKKLLFVFILFFIFISSSYAELNSEKTASLSPIVVTPWRTEESVVNISKNISVITQEEIKNANATYLYDLVNLKPGVFVSEQLGNPKGVLVDIRGFGEASNSNVLVLVDGRRTNQIDLSGVDWSQIDINSVKQIEIIRGPSTVLYGDNASAGVINIITKQNSAKKFTMNTGIEAGSHQYHKEYISIGDSCDFMDYFTSYSRSQTGGYRANNYYTANNYFAKISFYPYEEFNSVFTLGYHEDVYGMPGALYISGNPYALNPKGINQVGRRGTAFPDDRGKTEDFYITAEPSILYSLNDYEAKTSIHTSFRSRRTKGLNIPEKDLWGTPHSEYETIHHIKSYDVRPKTEVDFYFFKSKLINKLTFGADLFCAEDDVLSGERITGQDEVKITKQSLGIYFHDNINITDTFLINGGARGEWSDYEFDQTRLISNKTTKSIKDAAYELGAGYKYNKHSQVYVNFSRAFRNPNTEEFYQNKFLNTWTGNVEGGLNEDIKEQVSNNFEIGLKDATFSIFSINANYFWMNVKNEIYYDPSIFNNSNYKPKTIHHGFEIESELNLLNGKLKPYFNATIQEAYFKGGEYAGNFIPMAPKTKINTGVSIAPVKDVEISAGINYIGSRFKISDQNNLADKLKPHTTVDLKASYAFNDIKIYCLIDNALNKKYYDYGVTNSAGTAETFYPAQERTFYAGVSYEF